MLVLNDLPKATEPEGEEIGPFFPGKRLFEMLDPETIGWNFMLNRVTCQVVVAYGGLAPGP
jgi:hypothetical protein